MVFVSMGFRFRVEVEALNMVEALGATVRHRTVSVLKKVSRNGSIVYRVVMAPAISGQSIANGYQRILVEMAKLKGMPLCDECKRYEKRGGFTKRCTANIPHDERVRGCVVEDLTGFLAPAEGVRRTSPVSFSFMVPDTESSKIAIDPQFHVRYNFETGEHAPFTIESGTAIYMLGVSIDVDRIGKLSNGSYVNNRLARIELAFKALSTLIEGLGFGAKKARYLPIVETLGGIAAISKPLPFMVSPPRVYRDGRNYINDTIERAKRYLTALKDYGEEIAIVYMDREGIAPTDISEENIEVSRVDTVSELVDKVLDIVKTKIGQ